MERNESRNAAGTAAALVAATVLVVLLPLLYVASIGPIVWLADRDLIDTHEDSVVARIYRPLEWVAERSEPVQEGLELYVSLWQAPEPPPQISY